MKNRISNFILNVDALHVVIAIIIITILDVWVFPFTCIGDYITNIASGLAGGIAGAYTYRRIKQKSLK